MNKLAVSIITGFIISLMLTVYANSVQGDAADSVVRLHIIANSDSEFDQNIKLMVRDAVIEKMNSKFTYSEDKRQCQETIIKNLSEIEQTANAVLRENNISYTAAASYGKSTFPVKKYANVIFPSGEYDAVRIVLGGGTGQNWWCVMYPPLCFVNETKGEMQDAEMLKNALDKETYDIIVNSDVPDVEVRFKIVEIFNSIGNRH